jgi:hypothetical protein
MAEEVSGTLRALPLPEVRADRLAPVEPRTRVVIAAEGIDVDNVALFGSWPAENRRTFLETLPPDEAAGQPFIHKSIVRLSGWTMAPPDIGAPGALDIQPLRQVLEHAHKLEESYQFIHKDQGFGHKLNFYIDKGAPYHLLVRALYSAGQAGYGDNGLIVRGPKGDAMLSYRAPTMGARACPTPWITALPNGFAVRLANGALAARSRDPKPQLPSIDAPSDSAPAWQDRLVVASRGSCPSVPLKDGRQDLEALTALLRGIAEAAPTCGIARVTASSDMAWGDMANALETITIDGGFADVHLGAPAAASDASSLDCSGSLDLPALSRAIKAPTPQASAPEGQVGALAALGTPDAGPSAAASGSAATGNPAASGGGTVANAASVLAGMRSGFRRCYTRGLQDDPNMRGKVKITVKIGPNGEVLSATPSEVQGLSAYVIACITARVQLAQFAPPEGGGATVVIPVTLAPAEAP